MASSYLRSTAYTSHQLRTQRPVMSMGKLYFFSRAPRCFHYAMLSTAQQSFLFSVLDVICSVRIKASHTVKYSNLSPQYAFYPIAVETVSPLNEDSHLLLSSLGIDEYRQRQKATTARSLFCFREFLSLCSALRLYCCTTVL